jgi:hypothetical protein
MASGRMKKWLETTGASFANQFWQESTLARVLCRCRTSDELSEPFGMIAHARLDDAVRVKLSVLVESSFI